MGIVATTAATTAAVAAASAAGGTSRGQIPASEWELKALFALGLIGMLVGAWRWYKDFGLSFGVIIGSTIGFVVAPSFTLFFVLVARGIYWLFA